MLDGTWNLCWVNPLRIERLFCFLANLGDTCTLSLSHTHRHHHMYTRVRYTVRCEWMVDVIDPKDCVAASGFSSIC